MSSPRSTVLITGANQGIGFATACLLARENYNIVIAGRTKERLEEATKRIQLENSNVTVSYVLVDFCSIDSAIKGAKDVVERFTIDVLILNAGVLKPLEKHTADGHSTSFQVNYLAQYFFAQMIVDGRKEKRPIKIVALTSAVYLLVGAIFRLPQGSAEKWVESFDHSKGFWKRYAMSKYAMALLPQLFAEQENVTAIACNPGVVTETQLAHSISQSVRSRLTFLRGHFTSLDQAAQNVAFCLENEVGKDEYRNSAKVSRLSRFVRNAANVQAMKEVNELLRQKHNAFL